MSGAVEVRVPSEVAQQIRGIKPYLDRLLDDPARFAITLMAAGRRQPEIFQCSGQSIVAAALVCAQLDLEPGPTGHVWLIPRRIQGRLELTTMLGYKGMKVLAERHPDIRTVRSGVIHENDEWEYTAQPPSLTHRPAYDDRGDAIRWYAIAERADGGDPHIAVLDRAQVEARRARSQAANNGPWVTDFDAMGRKSAIRALWAELPSSLDMQRAARVDDVDGPLSPTDLGVPAIDQPDADADEDRPTITVEGRLVDEDTGEVLAEGDVPTGDTDPEAGDEGTGEGPASPATDPQALRIVDLQGRRGMDDHDLLELARDRTGVDADTVDALLDRLTDDQAGELIAVLAPQGTKGA